MSHVFISYVHEDTTTVQRLARDLKDRGVHVWLDREQLSPGHRWQTAIRSAIRRGGFFLACFSESSRVRASSYMNEELLLAIEELRTRPTDRAWFLPIALSPESVPDRDIGAGETLHSIQYVPMYEDWALGVDRLVAVITAPDEEPPATSVQDPNRGGGCAAEAMDGPEPDDAELLDVAIADASDRARRATAALAVVERIRTRGDSTILAALVARVASWPEIQESGALDLLAAVIRQTPPHAVRPALMAAAAEQVLGHRVFGQESAIREVSRRFVSRQAGLWPPASDGPRMVLLLAGPTGVGKTELARSLARLEYGDPRAVTRFDLGRYSDEASLNGLFGAPPGYVGFEQGGALTKAVQARPAGVVLLDSIEKAHVGVLERLLTVLDEGILVDSHNVVVSFQETIVVVTSNIGTETLRMAVRNGEPPAYEAIESHYRAAMSEALSSRREDGGRSPALWGRLRSSVTVLDVLRRDVMARIVGTRISDYRHHARANGVALLVDTDAFVDAVAAQLGPPLTWDVHTIARILEDILEAPLSRAMMTSTRPDTTPATITIEVDGRTTLE